MAAESTDEIAMDNIASALMAGGFPGIIARRVDDNTFALIAVDEDERQLFLRRMPAGRGEYTLPDTLYAFEEKGYEVVPSEYLGIFEECHVDEIGGRSRITMIMAVDDDPDELHRPNPCLEIHWESGDIIQFVCDIWVMTFTGRHWFLVREVVSS